jgi:hypothetical protein
MGERATRRQGEKLGAYWIPFLRCLAPPSFSPYRGCPLTGRDSGFCLAEDRVDFGGFSQLARLI